MTFKRVLRVVIFLIIIGSAFVILSNLWIADKNRKGISVELERIGCHAVLHVRAEEGIGGRGGRG